MARTSRNAERLLIDTGKRIARQRGCSGLRIREVADRAGVNLGLFHYHFGKKNRFVRVLLEEIYGEFFGKLLRAASVGSDPVSQLRKSAILIGRSMRDERKVLFALLRDVLSGDLEVIRYSKRRVPPHIVVFRGLIERCQTEGLLSPLPLSQVLPLFFGAIAQPLLIHEVLARSGKVPGWFDVGATLSDRAIAQRVDIVLRGMRAGRI